MSSLSSLHFGHYKAVINNEKLSEMHAIFMKISVNSGYSPKQWQKGPTVMLKKKQGVILVSKLWAFLLMEVGFNFANKTIFGSRMMHFAKDRNFVAGECAVSHQPHEGLDDALNCQLFCNIAHQKKCSCCYTNSSNEWNVQLKGVRRRRTSARANANEEWDSLFALSLCSVRNKALYTADQTIWCSNTLYSRRAITTRANTMTTMVHSIVHSND